jgi:type IV secretion system protein VirB10
MDNPDSSEEITNQDRDIPGLGKKKSRLGLFMMIVGSFILLILLIPSLLNGEEDENINEETFVSNPVPKLFIPKDIPLPEIVEDIKADSKTVYLDKPPIDNTETEAERLAREKIERIAERRKKAPVLIMSSNTKTPPQGEEITAQARIPSNSEIEFENDKYMQFMKDLRNGGPENKSTTKLAKFDSLLPSEGVNSVVATYLSDQQFMVLQGKMISAILETAIEASSPGMVRAIISEKTYSADGSNIVIPQGSRVVGNYKHGIQEGEERIFVVWNRIITPKGIDIEINSPGTGPLGRSGHSGWVDHHFIERFGSSVFLSVIGGVSANIAGRGIESNQQTISQVGDNFNKSSEISLNNSINIKPTLHKNHGESIKIFVARDINFKSAVSAGLTTN